MAGRDEAVVPSEGCRQNSRPSPLRSSATVGRRHHQRTGIEQWFCEHAIEAPDRIGNGRKAAHHGTPEVALFGHI